MRRSSNIATRRYRARFCVGLALIIISGLRTLALQDIGGTLAFQGQDIIGGAAIIFKPPKRVRDLAGNTAAMLASARRPSRSNRPTEVARNNSRPTPQPTPVTVATTTTAENRAEALKEQGNTHYDRGDYQQAIDAYQNAVKLDANDADVYNNLGAAYFNLNQATAAAAAFQKSISLKSDDADAFNNLGASLYRAGRYQQASEAFQNAVRLIPNDADALNNLGAVYYVLEQYDRALD